MNHIKFEKSTVIDVDMDADGGEVFNIAREDLDKKTHFKVIHYVMEAGIKLHLESVTLASACCIYHRFFAECELSNYDPYLIGATAIYLATKVEEQHVKLRDIINVCYRILHKEETPLEVGKQYWELRDSLVNCELLLVRMLKYNPKIGDLPHKYLVHYLKSLSHWMDRDVWDQTPVCRTAWAMLRDSYHSDICLRTKPQHMAVAVMYFSLQCYGLEVPLNDEAVNPWWKAFSEDISEEIIQKIITELIELYELDDKKVTYNHALLSVTIAAEIVHLASCELAS